VRLLWRRRVGPMGSAVPAAMAMSNGLVYGRRLKRYQCRNCGHQATLTAGTIMQATKLPLTTWFLTFYLIGQAKTAITSLELSRHLGVKYDTAWLLHNKILRAMADREEAYLLRGKIQIDDSYLGGELPGGKAGRGSQNKIPIVAAVSLNEAGHPIHARITAVVANTRAPAPKLLTIHQISPGRRSNAAWSRRANSSNITVV